jgi:hypothetical protein
MNKDIHNIFEAYRANREKLLNELAPVEFEGGYGGTGEEVEAQFPELSKGKYDLSPEETKAVFTSFIQKFRAAGGKSPKLYKDFFETVLAPEIRSVKPSINNTNAKYSARVLYNALKAAKVLRDERDGVSGVKLDKKPTEAGVEKLAKYTFKKSGELGKEDGDSVNVEKPVNKPSKSAGLDDVTLKRFWEKIYGEDEYSRKDLVRMYVEDNPGVEPDDAVMKISDMVLSGYLKKTDTGNYIAVDPEQEPEKQSEEEGQGSGEITSGIDVDEIEDINSDPWGGVYTGPSRGSGGMD